MNLTWKIKLIDAMILENPDYTIRDFLDMVEDIENIENPKESNMAHPGITYNQKQEILRMAETMTAKDIRANTNVAFSTIYRVLAEFKIDFHKTMMDQKAEVRSKAMENGERPIVVAKAPSVKKSHIRLGRPKAAYSNTGFLSLKEKYA